MRIRPGRLLGLVLAPLLLLSLFFGLTRCGIFRQPLLTVCTSRPEVAAYVELFNALGSELQAVLRYEPDPASLVAARRVKADVVIASGLNGVAAKKQLDALDRLFGEEGLQRGDFYGGLLETGLLDKRQMTLPLSFNLPAVVFLAGNLKEDVPNLMIDVDYLLTQGAGFNAVERERYVRMGFSPLWDNGFLDQALALGGADFREGADGTVEWSVSGLEASVAMLRGWVNETNGGLAKSLEFSRKYLYAPMRNLLDEKRVLFYLADSSEVLTDLELQRQEADFRWLAGPRGIRVNDGVVSVAIPRNGRNKWGGRIFVDWILRASTQRKLLEVSKSKRLATFGLAGGFSGLRGVNERDFPQIYPHLIGRIPPEELLSFPPELPVDWQEVRARVVVPWIREAVTAADDEGHAGTDLRTRIRAYRSGRPSAR